MTSLDSLPLRYSVASIRRFGDSDVFCGLRRIEDGEAVSAPYVLAIDAATEDALTYQVGVHLLTPNHKDDGVALVGVIVGGGHPALLMATEADRSLRTLREVDTTILNVEVAGPDAQPSAEDALYEGVFLYKPREAPPSQPTQRRPWWRLWRRG
jgi:hypothetical protein